MTGLDIYENTRPQDNGQKDQYEYANGKVYIVPLPPVPSTVAVRSMVRSGRTRGTASAGGLV
jgi:hypothetical protein